MSESKAKNIDARVENLIGGPLLDKEVPSLDIEKLPQLDNRIRSRQNEISSALVANLSRLSGNDLKERDRVIQHVSRAIEEIDEIEKKPVIAARQVDDHLKKHVTSIQTIQQDIVSRRHLNKEFFREFIGGLVDLTGPNRDTTALFLGIEYGHGNFLSNHTLNVTLLSISLAIEVSKLMEQKITSPEVVKDIRKVLICGKKIFTRQDIIDIGVAALLHDINYILTFPNMTATTKFDLREQSIVERHATESYHYLKNNYSHLEYDVLRAVYQHHERLDGSGAPNGVSGRFIARYTPILSFADQFILYTTPNPFHAVIHPRIALQNMLTKERNAFDSDVMLAYVKGAGLVPLGSWYVLENGTIGVAVKRNSNDLKCPIVRAYFNARFQPISPVEYDTSDPTTRIIGGVDLSRLASIVKNFKEVMLAAG